MPKSYRFLSIERPDIAEEWDYDKNLEEFGPDVNPDTVSFGSHKKVWWKCKLGHTWQTSVQHRTSKNFARGCPYCNHRKVWIGFNDLKTLRPELAEEWDYDKNIDSDGNKLIPEMFSEFNTKDIWWKCKFGHSWKTKIMYRTSDNTGCPICCKNCTSYPEQLIYLLLSNAGLKVSNRYTIGKLEFDIAIHDKNCYIEYNSKYHKGKEDIDNKKKKYCEDNNIKCIVIHEYKNFNFESNIDNKYSYYKYRGILHGNTEELLDIVNSILKELDINMNYNIIPDDIRINAYKYSHNHIKYEDSIEFRYPELANLFVDDMNNGITAKDLTPYSTVKVYWRSQSGIRLSKVHDIVGNYVKKINKEEK